MLNKLSEDSKTATLFGLIYTVMIIGLDIPGKVHLK